MHSAGYYLFFALLAVITQSCDSAQQCSTFKNGVFSYTQQSDVRIVRDSTSQKEYSLSHDFVDEFYVNWTGECSYFLTYKSSNNPEGTAFADGDTMFVEIQEVHESGYTFKAYHKGKVFENTMIAID